MNRFVVYDQPAEGKGCLGRCVWVFCYFEDRGLVLDYYAQEERASPRKKFSPVREYNRLTHNRNRDVESIAEDKVPLPEWAKDRAKELFFESVKVGKWGR